ncbi:putative carbonic anhydrase 2 [Iris pallida]|uniref:Carbonic anhydrase 2 n=1 Tax=Iris pallida TaxID=29817 RepID=A0AAX6IFT5_IRIPA|nr:putative carbonic anhydrase 2 [Iris pallida]
MDSDYEDGSYDDDGYECGSYGDSSDGGEVESDGDGSDGGEVESDGDGSDGGEVESDGDGSDRDGDGDGSDGDSDGSVYVEFDGASKGNPGPAGAGAVLRSRDGTVLARTRKGMGNATSNEAEYEGLKEGLKTARELGYQHVHVQGDSKLVTEQVQGNWKARDERMAKHRNEAQKLMDQFKSADIDHVPRGQNSEADAEANKGVNLPAGEVCKDGPLYGGGGGR